MPATLNSRPYNDVSSDAVKSVGQDYSCSATINNIPESGQRTFPAIEPALTHHEAPAMETPD